MFFGPPIILSDVSYLIAYSLCVLFPSVTLVVGAESFLLGGATLILLSHTSAAWLLIYYVHQEVRAASQLTSSLH